MSEFEKSEEYRCAKEAGIEKLCKKKRHDSSSQHGREKHRLFLHWLPEEDGRFLKESEGQAAKWYAAARFGLGFLVFYR